MITTKRISNGQFEVYFNDIRTVWYIINGSLGLSGRNTQNMYGIYNSRTKQTRWIGSLQLCKKSIALTYKKVTELPESDRA